jgi:hypothetical protein
MKSFAIVGFLSAMMVAVASNAMAGQQVTAAEQDNALNWSVARDVGSAYASARIPNEVRADTIRTNSGLPESAIDFQALGSN